MTIRLATSNEGRRATLTIDRPEKRNALDRQALEEFARMLDRVENDEAVRVLVIRGEGAAFCAGRDLADPEIDAVSPGPALRRWFNPLIQRIVDLPVPTIAAVRGPALGAGFGIAFACDLVVVSETAMIGSPFSRLGGVLDCGGHFFLRELVGLALAKQLVFTGRMLDGREAAHAGLAMRCVPDEELDSTVAAIAEEVGAGPTRAFALSKHVFNHGASLEDVLELEADAMESIKDTADAQEGRRAFVERRAPSFTGR